LLKAAILEELHALPVGQLVMLKLTLPDKDDLYAEFVKHPKVVRVVALSGGYTRRKATSACGGITAWWRAFPGPWSRGCRPAIRF